MSPASLQATRYQQVNNPIGVDPILLGVFISLLSFGLVMVFSSTIAMEGTNLVTNTSHLWKQSIHILLGITLTVVIANMPIWFWQKMSVPLLVVSFLLLFVLMFIGIEVNGSRRWMSVAGFRLQPAEIAKLSMVLYAASYLTRKQTELQQFMQGIFNIGLVLVVLGMLLMKQPDFGSLVVISATVGLMMFLGGIKITHTIFCIALAATAVYGLVIMAEYRLARIMSFRDPWADPLGDGYQLIHALIAVGRGEIFGVGLGASIQKLYYLPHANNDFILAVIAEELGLIGVIMVLTLFALLLNRALKIARRAELVDKIYAARLAQGVGFFLVLQAIIHIGVNLGALPTKGLTLPFISYGGSSMLVCCAAMGFLFAVDIQSQKRDGGRA